MNGAPGGIREWSVRVFIAWSKGRDDPSFFREETFCERIKRLVIVMDMWQSHVNIIRLREPGRGQCSDEPVEWPVCVMRLCLS
jgi:hypothetical protein